MAINTGRQLYVADIAATTDTTLLGPVPDNNRWVVTSLVAHSLDGGTGGDVDIFISTDTSSATSERVRREPVTADDQAPIDTPIALVAGEYLLCNNSVANISIDGTYTTYTGGDV